eukprot:1286026-Prymnesium_polylepis.1
MPSTPLLYRPGRAHSTPARARRSCDRSSRIEQRARRTHRAAERGPPVPVERFGLVRRRSGLRCRLAPQHCQFVQRAVARRRRVDDRAARARLDGVGGTLCERLGRILVRTRRVEPQELRARLVQVLRLIVLACAPRGSASRTGAPSAPVSGMQAPALARVPRAQNKLAITSAVRAHLRS